MKYDITFHPKWWYKNADIHFTQEFFDEPEYRMECDVKMRKALYEHFGKYGIGEKNPEKRPLLGSDLLAAGYLYSQLMGCDIIYEEDNSPQVVCMNRDEESIDDIKAPNLDESPIWQATQKQIDYLMDKYGRVESHINLQGIQNIAMDIMGQEVFMAYYSSPDEVKELLDEITKLTIDASKRLQAVSPHLSAGVTAILNQTMPEIYLTSNCSVEMVSNDLYEEFLLPRDQILAKEFPQFGIHHCGQTMEHVVEGYSKIPELKFAEVGAGSDIKFVREKLPNVFLNARYSPARLMNATKEEVEAEVKNLAKYGDSISCVGMDASVTDEQVINFLEACSNL